MARDYASATSCVTTSTGQRSCSIVDDGIYVAISNARVIPDREEYLLYVLVRWNAQTTTIGYEREVFVGLVDGSWQALRAGLAKVFQ